MLLLLKTLQGLPSPLKHNPNSSPPSERSSGSAPHLALHPSSHLFPPTLPALQPLCPSVGPPTRHTTPHPSLPRAFAHAVPAPATLFSLPPTWLTHSSFPFMYQHKCPSFLEALLSPRQPTRSLSPRFLLSRGALVCCHPRTSPEVTAGSAGLARTDASHVHRRLPSPEPAAC